MRYERAAAYMLGLSLLLGSSQARAAGPIRIQPEVRLASYAQPSQQSPTPQWQPAPHAPGKSMPSPQAPCKGMPPVPPKALPAPSVTSLPEINSQRLDNHQIAIQELQGAVIRQHPAEAANIVTAPQ